MTQVQKKHKITQQTFEEEVYVTFDGQEFDDIQWAEHHQTALDMNRTYLQVDAEFNTFKDQEELDTYVSHRCYSDTIINFNSSELTYPIRCCFEENLNSHYRNNGDDDTWIRDTTTFHIYTVDEYKDKIVKEIEEMR